MRYFCLESDGSKLPSVRVEDITFAGKMRIRMKLMNNPPHIQIIDLTFLEKPKIDYVLKPVGGETFGFDIASVSLNASCKSFLVAK